MFERVDIGGDQPIGALYSVFKGVGGMIAMAAAEEEKKVTQQSD